MYRFIDGRLLLLVNVDAQSGRVDLSTETRDNLLERVAALAIQNASINDNGMI